MKKTITVEVWKDEKGFVWECEPGASESKDNEQIPSYKLLGTRTIELDAPDEDAKPREFWIVSFPVTSAHAPWVSNREYTTKGNLIYDLLADKWEEFSEIIHVVELPPGHRVVSEGQISAALLGTGVGPYNPIRTSVLNALGFGQGGSEG